MNKKIKLLIVTSFDRPCGIAQYVEHLMPALQKNNNLEVSIAALPVDIFRSDSYLARKKAKLILNNICQECSKADIVNIQFEHGLYGKSPFSIYTRLKKIIKASKKIFITHHTCMSIKTSFKLSKNAIKLLIMDYKRNYVITKLLKICNKHKNNVYHIVHTKTDKVNMALYGQVHESHIFAEPLSFLTEVDKNNYKKNDIMRNRHKYFGYPMNKEKIIGVFGFLHEGKGIETAINALFNMSSNYHLAIIGGLHPEGIIPYRLEQGYITRLTDLIESKKDIYNRIHFFGHVNNNDFTNLMSLCDIVALPYSEVMQSSSGPAAIALDLGIPILCSNNRCFTELEKFANNCLVFCEISNYLEFARKAKLLCERVINNSTHYKEYGGKYNIETRARLYREICEK